MTRFLHMGDRRTISNMFLRFGGIRSHDLAIGAGGRLFWDRFGKNACTTAMNVFYPFKIPKVRFLSRT